MKILDLGDAVPEPPFPQGSKSRAAHRRELTARTAELASFPNFRKPPNPDAML